MFGINGGVRQYHANASNEVERNLSVTVPIRPGGGIPPELAKRIGENVNDSRVHFLGDTEIVSGSVSMHKSVKACKTRLTPKEFTQLTEITDNTELTKFVKAKLKEHAKANNLLLDDGPPRFSVSSVKENSGISKVNVTFAMHGTSLEEGTIPSNKKGWVILDVDKPQLTEVMAKNGLWSRIANTFGHADFAGRVRNLESDLSNEIMKHKATTGMLENKEIELAKLKDDKVNLEKENKDFGSKLSAADIGNKNNIQHLEAKIKNLQQSIYGLKKERGESEKKLTAKNMELMSQLKVTGQEIESQGTELQVLRAKNDGFSNIDFKRQAPAYWVTGILTLATVASAVLMVVSLSKKNNAEEELDTASSELDAAKAVQIRAEESVSAAEQELKAVQDANYTEVGDNAASNAVLSQIEQDRLDWFEQTNVDEIKARYQLDSSGVPQFNNGSLTDAGKEFMNNVADIDRNEAIANTRSAAVEAAQAKLVIAKGQVAIADKSIENAQSAKDNAQKTIEVANGLAIGGGVMFGALGLAALGNAHYTFDARKRTQVANELSREKGVPVPIEAGFGDKIHTKFLSGVS